MVCTLNISAFVHDHPHMVPLLNMAEQIKTDIELTAPKSVLAKAPAPIPKGDWSKLLEEDENGKNVNDLGKAVDAELFDCICSQKGKTADESAPGGGPFGCTTAGDFEIREILELCIYHTEKKKLRSRRRIMWYSGRLDILD